MWDSSIPYICSTLANIQSRRSGAHVRAWEEGYAVSSIADVKQSIYSSMSPRSSSSTLSLGI